MPTKTNKSKILEPEEKCGCNPASYHINTDNIGVCRKCGAIKKFYSLQDLMEQKRLKYTTGGMPHVVVSDVYSIASQLYKVGAIKDY